MLDQPAIYSIVKGKQMTSRTILMAVILAASLSPEATFAVNWAGKRVGQLQSTYDGADCIYFTLEGVTEADPIKPGDPFFAIPRSQYGAKDAYAMLLAAKISGQTVLVSTRGTLACGYAAVSQVIMQ